MIEHYSTRQVEPNRRIDFWNELVGQTYDGLVVDPLQPQFHAFMQRWRLDNLTLGRPRSAGAVVARRKGGSASTQGIVVHIVQSGVLSLSHRGKEVQLGPGDMVVCASEDYYRFDVKGAHELLVVEMDRRMVDERMPWLDDIIGERIPGAFASTRLLTDFMLSLWRLGAGESIEQYDADYASILINLIAASVRPAGDTVDVGHNPLVTRMKAFVDRQYADPGLSSVKIAQELGVSLRTLQMATAQAGTTPSDYLARARLEAAQSLLADRSLSIAAISFACGFGDQAYFSRRFSHHFGVCPSAYRKSN